LRLSHVCEKRYILTDVERSIEGKKMSAVATLSSKFQISVPKEVREKENWEPGQKLAFVRSGGGIMLLPVPTLKQLRGLAKGADTSNFRDRDDRS
jgi:AbrB family looped-hinge helix DNA binding protein